MSFDTLSINDLKKVADSFGVEIPEKATKNERLVLVADFLDTWFVADGEAIDHSKTSECYICKEGLNHKAHVFGGQELTQNDIKYGYVNKHKKLLEDKND